MKIEEIENSLQKISADATAMHPAARAVIGRYPLQRDLNVIYGFSRVHGIRLSDRTRVSPDTVVLMRLRNVGESTIYYEPRIRFGSSIRVRKAPGKQFSEGETKEWRRISFRDKPGNQVALLCNETREEQIKRCKIALSTFYFPEKVQHIYTIMIINTWTASFYFLDISKRIL